MPEVFTHGNRRQLERWHARMMEQRLKEALRVANLFRHHTSVDMHMNPGPYAIVTTTEEQTAEVMRVAESVKLAIGAFTSSHSELDDTQREALFETIIWSRRPLDEKRAAIKQIFDETRRFGKLTAGGDMPDGR